MQKVCLCEHMLNNYCSGYLFAKWLSSDNSVLAKTNTILEIK